MHVTLRVMLSTALAMALGAQVALADSKDSAGSKVKPIGFHADHWEATIGVQGAIQTNIGPVEAHEPAGLQLAVGRQIRGVRLAGEFSLVSFDGCVGVEDADGQIHRLGASVRYRIPVIGAVDIFGRPQSSAFGVYVGAGVGRQSIRYVGGGHSARSDAMLELGFEGAGGRKRFFGMEVGIRVQAAGRPPVPMELDHGSIGLVDDHTVDLTVIGTMSLLLGR